MWNGCIVVHTFAWWSLFPFIERLELVYFLGAIIIMRDVCTQWGRVERICPMSWNSELWCNCSWFIRNALEFTKCSSIIYGLLFLDNMSSILTNLLLLGAFALLFSFWTVIFFLLDGSCSLGRLLWTIYTFLITNHIYI